MISRKGLHLLIGITYLTAFLALSEPTQADTILQQQGTLERGDQVIELDGSLADLYTFTGEAGQQIRITLESSEFDAYLILLDPDSNQIADNDDANQSTHNAELVLTLPEDGTYSVIVNGYDRSDRGQYELTINSGTVSAATTASAMALQDLPDGDYRYYDGPPIEHYNPPSREISYTQSIILRKRGDIVIGMHYLFIEDNNCFTGTVDRNLIRVNAHGYQEHVRGVASAWKFTSSTSSIDLNDFRNYSRALNGGESMLEHCVEGMAGQ